MESNDKPLALSSDAIETQLSRILASHDFTSASRLAAFLDFVVRKTVAGNTQDIKEYAIGTEVFNRPESFDQRLDTIVRVQASKLRSRLTEYYATTGANDPIIIELPRGSYVPTFHARDGRSADPAGQTTPSPAVTASPSQRQRRIWILAALAGGCMLALAIVYQRLLAPAPGGPSGIRFTLPPPDDAQFQGSPAISPDGRQVFCRMTKSDGSSGLWLRPLEALSGQVLPGTERAGLGFTSWSQDGRFALFTAGNLHRIDMTRAAPPQLVPGPSPALGVASNRAGVILLGQYGSGIARMQPSGGTSSTITLLDTNHEELSHYYPEFLPDGHHFIYFAQSRNPEKNAIWVASLDGKVRKRLLTSQSRAQYAPTGQSTSKHAGYLLYVQERTLFARRFDPQKLELSDDSKVVTRDVAQGPYGSAAFSVSATGVLVYVSTQMGVQFSWFDRFGRLLEKLSPPGECSDPAISPDGRRVAFDCVDGANQDIWTAELASGHLRPLTFDPEVDHCPVWSPDGSRIAFGSHRSGLCDLYLKAASGVSPEIRMLARNEAMSMNDWSRDGNYVAFMSWGQKTLADIWILPVHSGGKPFVFLQSKWREQGAKFSPDSRWIAYVSEETGAAEVYVQPFDGKSAASGGKSQISLNGGMQPIWRADGKELYYLAPDGKLMVTDVNIKGSFTSGQPRVLFSIPAFSRRGPCADYDVFPDGSRFLVRTVSQAKSPPPIHVFINWAAALSP